MNEIQIVQAFFAALDANDLQKVDEYLDESYQWVGFATQPINKEGRLALIRQFRAAFPNLSHSLSNIRIEDNVVKMTVQLSGTNTGPLDLREMGIGVIPGTHRFVIFPNETCEFSLSDGKITIERDVSPQSPSRRLSGMLKELGVNLPAARL